jgi:hypothetical protein
MPDKIDEELHKFIDGPPVTKGSDIGLPASHPLAGADVLSQYTDDDAVEDGVLVDITQEANEILRSRITRWLISRALFTAALAPNAEKTGEHDGEPVIDVRPNLRRLIEAWQAAVETAGPEENEYWWFDFGLTEQVKACHNGQGRVTFCFPSDD